LKQAGLLAVELRVADCRGKQADWLAVELRVADLKQVSGATTIYLIYQGWLIDVGMIFARL